MGKIQLRRALDSLLRLRPPQSDRQVQPAGTVPPPVARAVNKLILQAAAFMVAADTTMWGAILRQRAGFLDREMKAGSPYDEARRRFICLFDGAADLPLDPPDERFGDLRDELNSFVDFPQRLRIVAEQTAEYCELIPLLGTRKKKRPAVPPPWPPPAGDKAARGRRSKRAKAAEAVSPPPPRVVLETWIAAIDRIGVLATQEYAWGSHLIVLSFNAYQPKLRDQYRPGWLAERMRDLTAVIPAVQEAAIDLVENPPARHGPDFRTVAWFGKDFHFAPTQAACVKVLWRAWENGTPDVGQETILDQAGSESRRLQDVFKNHKTWRELITTAHSGCYRLKVPS